MTSGKKKPDTKINKFVSIAGLILGLLGTIAGLAGIYYASEANRIAKEANEIAESQLTPKLTMLWVRPSGWNKITGNATQTGCDNTIRLYNPSGVPATITGHVTEITFQENTIWLDATNSIAGVRHDLLNNNGENLAESYYLTPESQWEQYNGESPEWKYFSLLDGITFPMQIDAYTATDIVNRVILTLTGLLEVRSEGAGNPNSYQYEPNLLKTFAPVELTLHLTLANGETLSIPKITCLYIEK